MKSLIIPVVLLLVLATGGGVGYYAHTVNTHLSEDSYQAIQERLRDIRFQEATLESLALKSRYGISNNYDDIASTRTRLAENLNGLAGDTFAAVIDGKSQDHLDTYRRQQEVRLGVLEDFKSHNSVLRNSIVYAPTAGRRLIDMANTRNDQASARMFDATNEALYEWILYGKEAAGNVLSQSLSTMARMQPDDMQEFTTLVEYSAHVGTVMNELVETDTYLIRLLSIPVQQTLAQLESSLADSYLARLDETRQATYAVYAFGALVLCVAAVFAVMLRRSYSRLEQRVHERTTEIQSAFNQLKESQEQLIQSEKMASLGQLVAGVAHEMNTPLGYVNSNFDIIYDHFSFMGQMVAKVNAVVESVVDKSKRDLLTARIRNLATGYDENDVRERQQETEELIADCRDGVRDLSGLVSSLRDFSRLDRQGEDRVDITPGIESTLKIAKKILDDHHVDVVRQYADLEPIDCTASKLNQVFLNIITNAAQAIPSGRQGQLVVTTEDLGPSICVRFTDNGSGMPEEVCRRIFEPFFTTKDVGQGTGLGLSISYKIINEHNGTIDVRSRPELGTTVTITLPKRQERRTTGAAES